MRKEFGGRARHAIHQRTYRGEKYIFTESTIPFEAASETDLQGGKTGTDPGGGVGSHRHKFLKVETGGARPKRERGTLLQPTREEGIFGNKV